MIHPLLTLIATKPQLLGDHVEAYAELLGAEVGKTSKMWTMRAVYGIAAAFLLATFVTFTGVATMLWAVVHVDGMSVPWLLVVVPLVPLVGGIFCILRAKAQPSENAFKTVKDQLSADLQMLREVSAAT